MKKLIVISLFLSATTFGQHGLSHLYEELPADSMESISLKSHRSVLPMIRYEKRLNSLIDLKVNDKSSFGLHFLSDQNYKYFNDSKYRFGAGAGVESQFANKWYLRLDAVSGVENADSSFHSKAFYKGSSLENNTYTDIRGRISFTPNSIFNFQVGLDNNFIGRGCRSLFLSDYGVPHPFGQIRTRFWRVEYTNLYQFYRENELDSWKSKFGATHHISLNLAKWLNLEIFETVLFSPKDTALNRGFDAEYLNPVIFYRPQEYAIGSADNVLIGVGLNGFWGGNTIYSQFVLDEFYLAEIRARSGWWATKLGGQLGVKGRFKSNAGSFFYRTEFNFVRPYTYAHLDVFQMYGNQGSTLAHPYGANFMEILGEFKWQNERWIAKAFLSYFLRGLDKDGYSYGGDIYQPYTLRPYEYGHKIGQGNKMNGVKCVFTLSYELLKQARTNVFLENHIGYWAQTNTISYFPVVGLRSQLWNDYRNY